MQSLDALKTVIDTAKAVREMALEEAAQIADDGTCIAGCTCCNIAKGIARAIRALKS